MLQPKTVRHIALVGFKLSLAQLAPLAVSLYLANLVATHGALEFSSFSMVTSVNLTVYIIAAAFLQGLYFVAGRAQGLEDAAEYDAAIFAGVALAGLLAVGAVAVSLSAGALLAALRFDAQLVALARVLGATAAAGIPAAFFLVVVRVHATLRGRAGLVTLLDASGALVLVALATSLAAAHQATAAVPVLLSVVAHNWLLLIIGIVGLAAIPQLRLPRPALATMGRRLLGTGIFVAAVGWPIGAVVLLDTFLSLSSSLLVGRYWVDVMPVHASALLWVMIGLVVPLGLSQAVVHAVSVSHARGDHLERDRAVRGGLAIAGLYGVVATGALMLAPTFVGGLLLGDAAHESQTRAWLQTIMPWAGALIGFQGIIIVAAAGLRGIGDLRAPLARAVVCYLVIGVGGELGFAIAFHQGVRGVWWGLALGFGCTALGVTYRCLRAFQPQTALDEKREEHERHHFERLRSQHPSVSE